MRSKHEELGATSLIKIEQEKGMQEQELVFISFLSEMRASGKCVDIDRISETLKGMSTETDTTWRSIGRYYWKLVRRETLEDFSDAPGREAPGGLISASIFDSNCGKCQRCKADKRIVGFAAQEAEDWFYFDWIERIIRRDFGQEVEHRLDWVKGVVYFDGVELTDPLWEKFEDAQKDVGYTGEAVAPRVHGCPMEMSAIYVRRGFEIIERELNQELFVGARKKARSLLKESGVKPMWKSSN